ncbi:MobC family plasmid mobilization relaxosome protein [uncultured Jannaschia sp.]|uniref:MobC family plasmid mobilization relaxosome protein n=1 Tax=uncultured Jannaschia sp. TaxID=293347 RepID=UPI002612A57D|nr:MobC family plasmid mobilization relaxosome protein [uncultured Jannaschia sp.]
MWIKIRVTEEQRSRWHATAEARGVSLSELVRHGLDGVRAIRRRHQPRSVDPDLLRELARIGNNLNQLARWANREKRAADTVAVVARLIELDRELTALRRAHETHADKPQSVV